METSTLAAAGSGVPSQKFAATIRCDLDRRLVATAGRRGLPSSCNWRAHYAQKPCQRGRLTSHPIARLDPASELASRSLQQKPAAVLRHVCPQMRHIVICNLSVLLPLAEPHQPLLPEEGLCNVVRGAYRPADRHSKDFNRYYHSPSSAADPSDPRIPSYRPWVCQTTVAIISCTGPDTVCQIPRATARVPCAKEQPPLSNFRGFHSDNATTR
jgi:hypothetical protein